MVQGGERRPTGGGTDRARGPAPPPPPSAAPETRATASRRRRRSPGAGGTAGSDAGRAVVSGVEFSSHGPNPRVRPFPGGGFGGSVSWVSPSPGSLPGRGRGPRARNAEDRRSLNHAESAPRPGAASERRRNVGRDHTVAHVSVCEWVWVCEVRPCRAPVGPWASRRACVREAHVV